MPRPDLILMGRSAGAFGLGGEIKVFSFARDPEVFTRAGEFLAGPNPESAEPYRLLSLRRHQGRLLVRLEGVTTREQAQQFKGRWIYLPQEVLPPLEEGEYYWFQVQGAEVRTPEGLSLGRLERVESTGPHDLWVVKSPQGWEAILPVVDGVVLDIDTQAGVMLVQPPPGLLSAQGWPPEYDQ